MFSFSASISSKADRFDIAIVGGGIVGCAAARELLIRQPRLKICVLEKENTLAPHQSGNNSGVIHAGLYYAPGSLKAKLCVKGLDMMYAYCDEYNVPYKKCGKLVIAASSDEIPRLDNLYQRALQNGCRDLELIDGTRIKEFEPHCTGLKALWSPHTGIVDFGQVTQSYGESIKKKGGKILTDYKVGEFQIHGESEEEGKPNAYPLVLSEEKGNREIRCKFAITCAGLQADRVAAKSGCSSVPKIVPFRGEYLLLKPEKRGLVRGNVYPVPDPRFPFLGFHFTPRMNGDVWLGPNAVLAFRREGYRFTDFNLKDLLESLTFSGMRKLMLKYFTFGVGEMYRRMFIGAQIKSLQRFVPELSSSDVIRGPAGVRAQALDSDGTLVDDFVFDSGSGALGSRLLHVRNAPSPAATSSLAIAEMVADKAIERFREVKIMRNLSKTYLICGYAGLTT